MITEPIRCYMNNMFVRQIILIVIGICIFPRDACEISHTLLLMYLHTYDLHMSQMLILCHFSMTCDMIMASLQSTLRVTAGIDNSLYWS